MRICKYCKSDGKPMPENIKWGNNKVTKHDLTLKLASVKEDLFQH